MRFFGWQRVTDVLVMFNTEKFMHNTKLKNIADIEEEKSEMEEFNLDDFVE